MLKSQGVIRRIIEKDGDFLVSFPEHDGYFTVPPQLRPQLREAHKAGEAVAFTYDIDLNIIDIAAP